jgi:hypothetical protein
MADNLSKTALVTGASQGIGYEFAKILAINGYDLVLLARNKPRLDEIQNDLHRTYGVKVIVFACDLSQPGACAFINEQIISLKLEIDVLVNNAGVGDWGLFVHSNIEKQEQMLRLNIMALTEFTRFLLPGMVKRRKGKILNVASTAAFQPGPLMAVYFATKAYVLSFSLAIAQELKGSGVTVTCLCPGPTATNFQTSTFTKEIRLTQGRKLPTSQEVANYGYKALVSGKMITVHGFINRLIASGVRFLPVKVVLPLVYFLQSTEIGA